jgi:predicted dehydrogenase/nucleoside-diphosphate-sugar epimerase
MSTARETRVALVGAGYVSAHHIRALQTLSHVRIVGIADASVERAQAVATRFGIPVAGASLADLRQTRPDVVHVLTPPKSHARLAVAAVEMGCDVFVEKPMAPTAAECDEMIAAARRTGRVLSVNHSAKDDPVIVRALDLLGRGVCGHVLSVDFYRTSDYPLYVGGRLPAAFRDGGYPFQDMGVHALYLMEAFLGPISDLDVRYRSTGMDPHVFFDEWRGSVACARGTGAFHLSWSARPIRNELVIHGTRGDMHVDCFLQTCTVRRSLPGPKAIAASLNAIRQAAGTMWHVPKNAWRLATGSLRPSPGIHAGVVRFHESLVRSVEPPVTMEEGRRVVGLLEPFCWQADADRDRALRLDEALEPRRILVTGASGLLGRALLDRLLESGESVRVLARRRSAILERMPGVQVVYGDLGDPDAVDRAVGGVQLVYHLGATMRGRAWADFEAGTVTGTANVVQSCLRHEVDRLVHVSSVTVLGYACQRPHAVVDERAPLERHPEKRGSYTRAKLLAERIVVDAAHARGLRAVVVRPGQIVGPGYESVSPYGTVSLSGRWIGIGSGHLHLPLVHVDDVIEGVRAAATRPDVCGRIFHLVDSTPITQRDYIAGCQQEPNGAVGVTYVPRTALLALGGALDVAGQLLRRRLPLTSYRIRSIKALTFDCTAARRQLGWEPNRPLTGRLRAIASTARRASVTPSSGLEAPDSSGRPSSSNWTADSKRSDTVRLYQGHEPSQRAFGELARGLGRRSTARASASQESPSSALTTRASS